MWHDLAKAFCLMLVLEGIMPFLHPSGWRTMLRNITSADDRTMRIMGLSTMILGAGLLYFLR